jgi:hypothetical protein
VTCRATRPRPSPRRCAARCRCARDRPGLANRSSSRSQGTQMR